MQKRKLLLSLVALCSIVGMGITSCNNEPVQGPQGEQGPVGPQGPAGENGENGEDGSIIHHGEGKPVDTLGKDSDIYIDSKTGDLYQKENGSWTLVMNIKGEDGQDGEDGKDGHNGSSGSDGATAWSNTILPTTGGVIGVSSGSSVVGDNVTFTFDPDDDYLLTEVYLNGRQITDIGAPVDGIYSYTTKMIKNGFVVSAKFDKFDDVGFSSYFQDGVLYEGGKVDAFGNIIEKGEAQIGEDDPKFASGDGLTHETALVVDDSNNISSLASDSLKGTGAKYFKLAEGLSTSDKSVQINSEVVNNLFIATDGEEKEVYLDLGGNNVDLPNSGNAYSVSNGAIVELSNGIIDNSLRIGNTINSDIDVSSGSTLTLKNVKLVSNGGLQASGDAATLNVIDSKIESSIYGFGTNAFTKGQDVKINIRGSNISANTEDGDNCGLYVNIPCDVYIENTTVSGDRQGMFVRQGNVTLKNVTIEYGENINNFPNLVTKNNKYLNGDWSNGNELPSAALVLGDRSNEENYQEIDSIVNVSGLTIKNRNKTETANASIESTTVATTPTYYLYAYDSTPETNSFTLNIDKESYDKIPENKMFNKDVIINVEGIEPVGKDIFFDGQLYSTLYLNGDGAVNELLSKKVDGVKFGGGTGTLEDPLCVDNINQLELLNNLPQAEEKGTFYVKLSDEFPDNGSILSNTINLRGHTSVNIDFNEKEIYLSNDGLFLLSDYSDLTITGYPLFKVSDGESYEINGNKVPAAENGWIFLAEDNSYLTLLNGNFVGGVDVVLLDNNSICEILDGIYKVIVDYDGKVRTLNKQDGSNSTYLVKGGKFYNYDPSKPDTENPQQNFLAEGYKVELSTEGNDKIYTVVPSN